jgi:hypothetical protein
VKLATANASRWRGQAGHYEAWHLRLLDPASASSAWIRHSFRAPASGGGDPLAETWFVGRLPGGELYARQETHRIDQFQTGAGGFPITVASSTLDEDRAQGRVDAAHWNLSWEQASDPVEYGSGTRLRRPEIVVSQPAIRVSGMLGIGDQEVAVRNWPAQQVHAWGSRHAEVSARVHCNAFAAAADFVEVASRRYDHLGRATPLVTMGSVSAGGFRHSASSMAAGIVSHADFEPDFFRFTLRGPRTRITGSVQCALDDLVGVAYRDPDGSRVFSYQADRAQIEVRVQRRRARGWSVVAELAASAGCAYEYAARKPVPGVPVVL